MHVLSILDDFPRKGKVFLEHSLSDEGKQQACVTSTLQEQVGQMQNRKEIQQEQTKLAQFETKQ